MKKTEYFLLSVFFLLFAAINAFIIAMAYTALFDFFAPANKFPQITANIFSVILASLVVFTAVLIILERRDPTKTLAWLLILIFIPLIGFLLYLIFGRQFRKRRLTAKKRVLNDYIYPLDDTYARGRFELPETTKTKEQLIRLICNNAEYPVTLYNEVEVLTDGEQAFPAMLQALECAREHIHLETYILRDDSIGTKIGDLLAKKAEEGVQVKVIYDGLGSRDLSNDYLQKLSLSGVRIEPFFPVRLPFLHNKINYRNHRKILVIDGSVGFVGGINIGDDYLGRNPSIGRWRDTHLRIRGNAVYFLQRIFLQDWYFVTKESYESNCPLLFPPKDYPGDKIVQITSSGPDTHWEAIMQVYYYAIATAYKSIYLTSPYFIPNESILTALKTASLSGVDVKILLPAKPDYKVVLLAALSYLEELMEAGVEVYMYEDGFVHSKVLTIDGVVSSIGSANMDQRSFSLNFEVNALIYNEAITQRLEQDFFNDLKLSRQLSLDTFRERPLVQRLFESAARLLSPLL